MGCSASRGAQDVNGFRYKMSNIDKVSLEKINMSDITCTGLFNEYYFNYKMQQTDKVLDFDLSTARSINPFTNETQYFINVGLQSKFDGKGVKVHGRPPTKIIILLDISGSMNCNFEGFQGQQIKPNEVKKDFSSHSDKINIAKNTLIKMLQIIRPDDHLGLVIFNQEALTVLPLT